MPKILGSVLLFIAFYFFLAFCPTKVFALDPLLCTVSPRPGTAYTYSSDPNVEADLDETNIIPVSFTVPMSLGQFQSTYRQGYFNIGICNEGVNGAFLCNGGDYRWYRSSDNEVQVSGTTVTVQVSAREFADALGQPGGTVTGDYKVVMTGRPTIQTYDETVCRDIPSVFSIELITRSSSIAPVCSSFRVYEVITAANPTFWVSYDRSGIQDLRNYWFRFDESNSSQSQNSQRFSSSSDSLIGTATSGINTTIVGRLAQAAGFSFSNVENGGVVEIMSTTSAGGTESVCTISLNYDPDTGRIISSLVNPGNNPTMIPFNVCEQVPGARDATNNGYTQCTNCLRNEGIWTAIGCVESSASSIVQKFLTLGLGIGGGIALLMIIAAGFLFSTSQGEPKRTQEARDLVTSAIIGLLFIIFSVTILQFIGVKILQIPGFAG